MRHSTTFQRIVNLYDAERRLLDAAGERFLSDEERQRFRAIRSDIEQLWPKERQERVFALHGPPQIISAPDPRSHRQIAYGIAPLPGGGERRAQS